MSSIFAVIMNIYLSSANCTTGPIATCQIEINSTDPPFCSATSCLVCSNIMIQMNSNSNGGACGDQNCCININSMVNVMCSLNLTSCSNGSGAPYCGIRLSYYDNGTVQIVDGTNGIGKSHCT